MADSERGDLQNIDIRMGKSCILVYHAIYSSLTIPNNANMASWKCHHIELRRRAFFLRARERICVYEWCNMWQPGRKQWCVSATRLNDTDIIWLKCNNTLGSRIMWLMHAIWNGPFGKRAKEAPIEINQIIYRDHNILVYVYWPSFQHDLTCWTLFSRRNSVSSFGLSPHNHLCAD